MDPSAQSRRILARHAGCTDLQWAQCMDVQTHIIGSLPSYEPYTNSPHRIPTVLGPLYKLTSSDPHRASILLQTSPHRIPTVLGPLYKLTSSDPHRASILLQTSQQRIPVVSGSSGTGPPLHPTTGHTIHKQPQAAKGNAGMWCAHVELLMRHHPAHFEI